MIDLDNEIKLETKLVGAIDGCFYVPSYQRGYRWGKEEVVRLLDDVYKSGSSGIKRSYCLQPIVVRRRGENEYELIDGQQRLTTIYLIYKYLHNASFGFMKDPSFSLTYETREKSKEFLEKIDLSKREDNVDFSFMADAYVAIEGWFRDYNAVSDPRTVLTNLNTYFAEDVRIIWYEIGSDDDAISLFTRLNIGKIPLTNAELVKAIFLCSDGNKEMSRERQDEIALQWDSIEKELHNDSLWFFLTNSSKGKYQTHIDLILDLVSGKKEGEREKYFTFFYVEKQKNSGKSLVELWDEIQQTFLILKDWWEEHELYHKIGYLITSKECTLGEVYALSKDTTKTEFKKELDSLIKRSIAIGRNYAELSYEKNSEYAKISRLLLLFNIESVRQHGEHSQWFPFDKFKDDANGKIRWSLEHIHAQHAEIINKDAWREWIKLHIPSIKAVLDSTNEDDSNLVEKMELAKENESLREEEFSAIQEKVFEKLSADGSVTYLNSISNLALLNTNDNAVLNNSAFDAKRNEIIEMDKAGKYIPFCTRMAFLKYYTSSDKNSEHFWGQPDRISYVEHINEVLKDYLEMPIELEEY